jgi:predicted Zn-dependent peptidase
MTLPFEFFNFAGGLRMVYAPSSSQVAHLAVYINAGSRDETEKEHGIAHFIEHTAFKGTTKRKAYHILSRLDDVGGDMNAFTTKEHTCIHASFISEHTNRAIELFSDIILNAVFPEKELEKEKSVVLDEISAYKDSPSESIFDDYEELIYAGHPIGRNILGTPESLEDFNRKTIIRFIHRNYTASEMVIAYIGNIPSKTVVRSVERHFQGMTDRKLHRIRKSFTGYKASNLALEKDTHQTHISTGTIAWPMGHPRKLSLQLLNNILGGPASNSRLFMALRERNGCAYHVESNYQPYSDTGYISVYMGINPSGYERAMEIMWKELNRLKNEPLGQLQLHRARHQVAGQIALSHESKLNEMLWMGRRYLYHQYPETIEQTLAAIEKISAADLLEVANEIFVPEAFSTLTYLGRPVEDD